MEPPVGWLAGPRFRSRMTPNRFAVASVLIAVTKISIVLVHAGASAIASVRISLEARVPWGFKWFSHSVTQSFLTLVVDRLGLKSSLGKLLFSLIPRSITYA